MRPYYQDDFVTLYHGRAQDLLPHLPQADTIVTDPPYAETSLVWDRWPQGWPTLAMAVATQMWCFGSTRMFMDRAADCQGWHSHRTSCGRSTMALTPSRTGFAGFMSWRCISTRATGETSTKSLNSTRTPRPVSCAARAAPAMGRHGR
jgi:hypothetical protein